MTEQTATAVAPSNIAFVKYWGKADAALNTPAAGSLSMTLRDLLTTTTVAFDDGLEGDVLILNGAAAPPKALDKARPLLDIVRQQAGISSPARIDSANSFPTGAGLASSASGLAALALAASTAAGLRPSREWLSALARRGSGSASRSLFGGFVEWLPGGQRADGLDSHAVQVAPEDHWDLRMLVVVVRSEAKSTSSTAGMARTAVTSPYFRSFIDTVPADLRTCRRAIAERDFEALTEVVESSALKMHASMMTSSPALLYWKPETLRVMETVYALRAEGAPVAFTIDAGPNVKVLLPPAADADGFDDIRARFASLDGVRDVLATGPGPGAWVVEPGSPQ